jgi:hypothetical protein
MAVPLSVTRTPHHFSLPRHQACPYVIFLFVVPVHYFTHVFLLFFSGVWATNIHDALVGWACGFALPSPRTHTFRSCLRTAAF